ncbi:MAG: 4Fe-4S binding protein [Bacteroidaceae bacterium]
MKRTVIKIDESLCNGCGLCVKGCHEGALQLINNKATLVSELYCDGLGACIGDCPEGAITLEEREAVPYDEKRVMDNLVLKGETVIKAHLKHLYEHDQPDLLEQGIAYLKAHQMPVPVYKAETASPTMQRTAQQMVASKAQHTGCPGSKQFSFSPIASGGAAPNHTINNASSNNRVSGAINGAVSNISELQQWPVQLHLLSPTAPYLKGADLLVAADCTAYSVADFHTTYLKGKRLAIACPKLDHGMDIYLEKLVTMIDAGGINTLTLMIMEVPCCGGLYRLCEEARKRASRNIPLKLIKISVRGEVLEDSWM